MQKTEISAKQMEATVAMFLIGSSLVKGGSSPAKQDTWICIIIAVFLTIPLMWVHTKILNLYPGRNYYRNILRAMGRPAGTVVCLIFTLYTFHLGALVMRIFSEFIHIAGMTSTPIIAISAAIVAVLVYVLTNRLYVLARISKFMLPFLYITVAITIVLSYQNMDLRNILPILNSKPSDLFQGVLSALAVPYGEILICAPMFGALSREEKIFPTLFKGVLLGFVILFSANLRNFLTLGYSVSVFQFPSYESVSLIQFGDFFTRIEVLIGINLLLAGFFKCCVLLFSACDGLCETLGLRDYEPLVAPSSLLIMTLSGFVVGNTLELFRWMEYMSVYTLPFQVLLPVLVLIVGAARKKFSKPKKQGKNPDTTEEEPPAPRPQES
ncbi:GerAB/ArcD/ProY family transporter [Caproicibacter sp.]|uniref:GerAB/ArcD/ProY family transporter n=1 Tax=Caproicibacter sp. TaxID=2814884 RepID=UPI0039891C84